MSSTNILMIMVNRFKKKIPIHTIYLKSLVKLNITPKKFAIHKKCYIERVNRRVSEEFL